MDIQLIIFDIDGVLTDGAVLIDAEGREHKRISLNDLDAFHELKNRGYKVAAITGENTGIVTYFEKRYPWDSFRRGCKKKKETMDGLSGSMGIPLENICYIGDGKYDTEAIMSAGLGVCPANAVQAAKNAADIVLESRGGDGCVRELADVLERLTKGGFQEFLQRSLTTHLQVLRKLTADEKNLLRLERAAEGIAETIRENGTVYLYGTEETAGIVKLFSERLELLCGSSGRQAEADSNGTAHVIVEYGGPDSRSFIHRLRKNASGRDLMLGVKAAVLTDGMKEAFKAAAGRGMRTVLFGEGEISTGFFPDGFVEIPSGDRGAMEEIYLFLIRTISGYISGNEGGRQPVCECGGRSRDRK